MEAPQWKIGDLLEKLLLSNGRDKDASGELEFLSDESASEVEFPCDFLVCLPWITIHTGYAGHLAGRTERTVGLNTMDPRAGNPLIVQGDDGRDSKFGADRHQIAGEVVPMMKMNQIWAPQRKEFSDEMLRCGIENVGPEPVAFPEAHQPDYAQAVLFTDQQPRSRGRLVRSRQDKTGVATGEEHPRESLRIPLRSRGLFRGKQVHSLENPHA